MNLREMDQLVRRANAAGFDSIADYAAELELQNGRLDAAVDAAVSYIEALEEDIARKAA